MLHADTTDVIPNNLARLVSANARGVMPYCLKNEPCGVA